MFFTKKEPVICDNVRLLSTQTEPAISNNLNKEFQAQFYTGWSKREREEKGRTPPNMAIAWFAEKIPDEEVEALIWASSPIQL